MSNGLSPARIGRALARFAFDPVYREAKWLAWRGRANLFQPFSVSLPDRYPVVFRRLQAELPDGPGVRILSFGCATGEEIQSLRSYFPLAHIKGIDIGNANVRAARRRMAADTNVEIVVGNSTAAEADSAYDAILCMSVLRDGRLRGAERSDAYLKFSDFETAIGDFGRCLKPGGLLALRHSNFRFEDTAASAAFAWLLEVPLGSNVPKFGRDNRRLPHAGTEKVLFRKARS